MIQLFKSYDEKILKSKPLVWITALHWILPLAIILCVLTYLYGWFLPYDIELTSNEVGDFIYPAIWITVICVIILVVVYFIRQIRFNALRVHHSLPYQKPYLHFFIFLITLIGITAIPHMASLGALHKSQSSIDQDTVAADLEILDLGVTHFVAKERFINYSESQYDTLNEVLKKKIIKENSSENNESWHSEYKLPSYFIKSDTVYLTRSSMSGYNYNNYGDLLFITLAQAKKEIADFRIVAQKYGGRFKDITPMQQILDRATFSENGAVVNYNNSSYQDFNSIHNEYDLKQHYSLHKSILAKDKMFYAGSWSFWKYYFILPFFLSLLLYVLSVTKLSDFGWSLLISSLTFVFGGILSGLFSVLTSFDYSQFGSEWFYLVLMSVFLLIYIYIIHYSSIASSRKRTFAIALHLLVPFIFWFYWLLGDELHECRYGYEMCTSHEEVMSSSAYMDLGYFLLVLACTASVYLFNRYYTQQYVNPSR